MAYHIQSRFFSTENPAFALVDDKAYPNEVVCYKELSPDYKTLWKVIPHGPPGSSILYLQLAGDQAERQAKWVNGAVNLLVDKEPGTLWAISPPLYQGGPDTPRFISTAINDLLHISEWTIYGEPEDGTIPKSFVTIKTRTFQEQPDPKSVWYIEEVVEN